MLGGHVRNTMLLGLCPLFISAVLLQGRGGQHKLALWFILLAAIGLEFILLGGHLLINNGKVFVLKKMQMKPDFWFPWTVFTSQNIFILLMGGTFWITIIVLGFPAQTWQHVLLGITILIIPLRRSLNFTRERFKQSLTDEALHLLTITLGTFFLAGTLSSFIIPPGQPTQQGSSVPLMVIWIIAILVALFCLILFLDHLTKRTKTFKKEKSAPKQF